MRCSRPGVPGIAHGRASVSGSRRYGWKSSPLSAREVTASIAGIASTSGSSHGSEPFARYASESRNTGVRYLIAIRAASNAASKQSPGVARGDHRHRRLGVAAEQHARAGRPAPASSACPVDGPARWTSTITSGSSSVIAEPDRLLLQHDAGAARRRDAERAAEASRRARRRRRRSRPPPGTCARRSSCGARAPRGSTTRA